MITYKVLLLSREGYYRWVDHSIPYAAHKGKRGGLVTPLSACDDDQNSGDTTVSTQHISFDSDFQINCLVLENTMDN